MQENHTPSCPSVESVFNASVCEYDRNVQNFDSSCPYIMEKLINSQNSYTSNCLKCDGKKNMPDQNGDCNTNIYDVWNIWYDNKTHNT